MNGDNNSDDPSRGNHSRMLVNDPSNMYNGIIYSLFVGFPNGDFVETGWLRGTDWGTQGTAKQFEFGRIAA